MCGIFAVLGQKSERQVPTSENLRALLQGARDDVFATAVIEGCERAGERLTQLNELLKGVPGARALLASSELMTEMRRTIDEIADRVNQLERELDSGVLVSDGDLERMNCAMVVLKDAVWAISRDRLRTASEIAALATGEEHADLCPTVELSEATVAAYFSIQLALSAINRLEVRGRDSAGIAVLVSGHGIPEDEARALLAEREHALFLNRSTKYSNGVAVFVYKAAAEIGALGDNIRAIRRAIRDDALLQRFLSGDSGRVTIISHTRWASVGTISEPNAHPVDSYEIETPSDPYIVAALNGDVDNYAELKIREQLRVPDEITSDTKVIPTLTSKHVRQGEVLVEAFRHAVDQFLGSVAIAAASTTEPDKVLLAVCGSGQGCYIGLAEDAFVVASEPYGLAEVCARYVRVDGETASETSGKRGQVVELLRERAGTLDGIIRRSYGGEVLPVSDSDITELEVTTRDIDRGDAPHFLLKEISEAPLSMKRTIRGKIAENNRRLTVALHDSAFPQSIRDALRNGSIKQVIGIGQGTAYVASRSLGSMLETLVSSKIGIAVKPATELSGFGLRDDMSDTLIVAVSQSGTTTDTNRTVDMVRARGGRVIAIVNRRQSDLTEKADGVLYTSDGRDVEMSVASTKAFYAQVTACTLLGLAIAEQLDVLDRQLSQDILGALRDLPNAMFQVLQKRDEIGELARRYAPYRKSWAIVGNGPNHIAANEVRIKLSELCYKSIACDITEDKKHIDLSAEPLILVCAAGLTGANASDVAKEVAIYKAHKAIAIVVASDGERFDEAAATVVVPKLHPSVDFILSTMVGHLFGYEAALAIDAQGKLLRTARGIVEDALADDDIEDDALLGDMRRALWSVALDIFSQMKSGALNGHLDANSAAYIASLLRYSLGILPLESLEFETGEPTSPRRMLSDLVVALSRGIDELTRPIDAVKHQAKTVTVGISRTEATAQESELVDAVLGAGAARKSLGYRTLRTLQALDPGVKSVVGFTRYEVAGRVADGATLRVVGRGGVASDIASRTDTDPRLTGTKHRAAYERMVTVGKGLRDNRSVIIVPETTDGEVTGITLLHVEFVAFLAAKSMVEVLKGYRNRYSAIADVVMETQPHFDDEVFAKVPVVDLLVEPVRSLAHYWN